MEKFKFFQILFPPTVLRIFLNIASPFFENNPLFLLHVRFKRIDIKTCTLRRNSTNERTNENGVKECQGFEISCNARRRYAHVNQCTSSSVRFYTIFFRKRRDRPSPDTRENFRPPPSLQKISCQLCRFQVSLTEGGSLGGKFFVG